MTLKTTVGNDLAPLFKHDSMSWEHAALEFHGHAEIICDGLLMFDGDKGVYGGAHVSGSFGLAFLHVPQHFTR